MITIDMIQHASSVLKNIVRKTDLIVSPALSTHNNVYLKTENLQVTGSFKIRGAYYKISQLSEEDKAKGIIACSAGNHAQGVALAAQKNNIPCLICMPDGAPISKVEATESYGAEICLVASTYDDAYDKAVSIQKEKGSTFIHPFDDDYVIAGQGTIGLEILEQLDSVDAIVVPIGGGGLISGIALAIKTLKPSCKIIGVEAENAKSMQFSLKNKKISELDTVNTFADGIAVKKPGVNTFEYVSKYVDEVVTVTEGEIAAAVLTLIEKQKLIAEGAGAVSVAAVMFDKIKMKNKNVVCIVSGGNIDVNILNRVIKRALIKTGRRHNITISLFDKPRQLSGVTEIISNCGGNVIEVHHDHYDPNLSISKCYLKVVFETKNQEQAMEIKNALKIGGFDLVE